MNIKLEATKLSVCYSMFCTQIFSIVSGITKRVLLKVVFTLQAQNTVVFCATSLGLAKVNVVRLHHYTIFLRLAHFGLEFCN
jgi:hypothetical protein